jgi:hypothetical protein
MLLRLRHKHQKLHEKARIYFVVDIWVLILLSVFVQRLWFYALIKTAVNFTILRDYFVKFCPSESAVLTWRLLNPEIYFGIFKGVMRFSATNASLIR